MTIGSIFELLRSVDLESTISPNFVELKPHRNEFSFLEVEQCALNELKLIL